MTNVDILTSPTQIDYDQALDNMAERVTAIQNHEQPQAIWFLEHPPIYTAGSSAKMQDLLNPIFPIHETGRGGQYTYHGPGQRVVYAMLDLNHAKRDLRWYVRQLEEWIILSLARVGVIGERRDGRIGIWVAPSAENSLKVESKIAAVGVRVQKWVTSHGVSINVSPDLDHFKGIVPCGLADYGVTSLAALGKTMTLDEWDQIMVESWSLVFGDYFEIQSTTPNASSTTPNASSTTPNASSSGLTGGSKIA